MLCYIGIGSNLGDRQQNIKSAIEKLNAAKGVIVKRVSNIYETDPVGGPPQGKYLNGAIEIDTEIAPRDLLDVLLGIEKYLGRIRTVKNAPRTIDLDILLYGDEKIDESDLKIPHPRMREREFVMKPLKELIEEARYHNDIILGSLANFASAASLCEAKRRGQNSKVTIHLENI